MPGYDRTTGAKTGHPDDLPSVQYPLLCQCRSDRVKQVLINLLSNAIKYNQAGGTVDVACTASAPERIRISVTDTGAGLPAEKLAQLFQPFNRLARNPAPRKALASPGGDQATGRIDGGVIGVESTIGVGSVFWFELSVAAPPQIVAGTTNPRWLPKRKFTTTYRHARCSM